MAQQKVNKNRIVDYTIKGIVVLLVIGIGILYYSYKKDQDSTSRELQSYNKEEHQRQKEQREKVQSAYDMVDSAIKENLPGIVCWGDTVINSSEDANLSYPYILQNQITSNICSQYDLNSICDKDFDYLLKMRNYSISIPVVDMSIDGEDVRTILGRSGAVPFVVKDSFTIPTDKQPVKIKLESKDGKSVAPLRKGTVGMEYVIIAGIKGTLSLDPNNEGTYYFTREKDGKGAEIPDGTEVMTACAELYKDYFPVLFMGENGTYEEADDLIKQQKELLNHQTIKDDRYLILSIPSGSKKEREEFNHEMEKAYGDRYINLREYLDVDELENDKKKNNDTFQLNVKDCETIGHLIYDKMEELGYFNEVKDAITKAMNQ